MGQIFAPATASRAIWQISAAAASSATRQIFAAAAASSATRQIFAPATASRHQDGVPHARMLPRLDILAISTAAAASRAIWQISAAAASSATRQIFAAAAASSAGVWPQTQVRGLQRSSVTVHDYYATTCG